ncbi:MAG: M42 family peptidase [Kiritimatiellia bacterium]|jgi:endoglucanase|nr:M42 family peptidase [Kiritimatiellia bacterium]
MNSKLLERVCNAPGVAGFEGPAQDVVTEVLQECCDDVQRDRLGNVIAIKKATTPPANVERPIRVMLAAHSDEIGMMVKHINDKGFIHFIQMGGLNAQVIESQRVIIHGKKPVRGVVVPKTQGKDEKPATLDDLLIDTGLSKKELSKRIDVGDIATFEDDASLLNGKMWVGRNFDDRIGTYTLLETMRNLGDTCVDVYAVSSVQEEVGLRGARPAAFGVAPDIGIAIDGSMARGAYVEDHKNLCEPGKGTGIYMVDNLTIGHPGLVRYLFDLCKKHKIPYQRNIGGGTDAQAMQQSRAGVIATTVGAPVRYMHSTVQLCHADDMDSTVTMLVKFMEAAHEFMASL